MCGSFSIGSFNSYGWYIPSSVMDFVEKRHIFNNFLLNFFQ